MRIANHEGRLVVVAGDPGHELAHDVEKNSGGRFGPEPQAIYEDWDAFTGWAASASWEGGVPVRPDGLGSPAPAPRQVFGIGLNYRDHAAESGLPVPTGEPPVFTKFPSCITGPWADIELPPDGHVDWEVELVAIIGRRARQVTAEPRWYVAGYAVGRSRALQLAATPPQFSMGKAGSGRSAPGLVTLTTRDRRPGSRRASTASWCSPADQPTDLQRVPALVANLSASVVLLPGDVIFTGTPAGVGLGRDPQRWLADGDVLTSHIEGIGEMRHRFVAPPPR